MTALTQKVITCRETGDGCSKLVQELSLLAYRYPGRKYGWSEDECSDFFCTMFKRIPGMIDRFTYNGSSFEAFFYSTLRWHMKTFSEKQRRRSAYRRVAAEPPFWTVNEAPEPFSRCCNDDISPPLRREFDIDESGVITDRASLIRVLCITLRHCEFVDHTLILRVSRLCGCSVEWLSAAVNHLRERLEDRREMFKAMQERRNAAFLRICLLHDALNHDLDRYNSDRIMSKLETEKAYLKNITAKIKRYPLFPTHREIGQVLGIPKGTVDSGLYHLKNRIEHLLQLSEIGYARTRVKRKHHNKAVTYEHTSGTGNTEKGGCPPEGHLGSFRSLCRR